MVDTYGTKERTSDAENQDPSVLEEATEVVTQRENVHGTAAETHRRIARLWTAYLDLDPGTIEAHDAAVMLDQLSDARIRENPKHRDNWVDKAGYSYCGYECVKEYRNE